MREISRLRRCINDLASIMALPAVWVGSDRSRVIGTLLAVSVRMLELDFAYAPASDFADESPCEWMQYADSIDHPAEPPEVGRVLEPYLAGEASTANFRISNPVGSGTASIAVFRLGVQNKIGVFVAGSRRSEFPTKIEIEPTRAKARHDSDERFRQLTDSIPETIRLIIDSTPALIHTALPGGHIDFFNQTWLRYVVVRLEKIKAGIGPVRSSGRCRRHWI